MSLQFIFGNANSDKSRYVYQQVIELSIANPSQLFFVVVPEQFTMQTQKELCKLHPKKGIMNIDVLSFGRLAYRVLGEIGYKERIMLDEVGKSLVVKKIATKLEPSFRVLKGTSRKMGNIGEIKSVLSEFTQYNVTTSDIEHLLQTVDKDSLFGQKMQDILLVFEAFREFMGQDYVTKEEILELLIAVANESNSLKDSVLILDGFTGFTPMQMSLLKELLTICKKIYVTISIEEGSNPFFLKEKEVFSLSKETVSSLMRLAKKTGTFLEEPVKCYKKNAETTDEAGEVFAHLGANIFQLDGKPYEKEQEAVSLFQVNNQRAEVSFVVEQIRKIVRSEGLRYQEVAVVTNSLSSYATFFKEECIEADIPIFIDQTKSVMQNAFVEFIRSLISMVETGFEAQAVLRCLRTGFFDFTIEEIDDLEVYLVALGIRGFKSFQKPFEKKMSTPSKIDLDELNRLRVKWVDTLEGLLFVLRQKKKTVEDITRALCTFFIDLDIQKKLMGKEKFLREIGEEALAKEYSQVYKMVIDLFDQLMNLLGKETIGLKEYADLLDAGFAEANIGIIPPASDAVVIGDITRTRLSDIKVLFVMGITEESLPGDLSAHGFLTDLEREKFASQNIPISPSREDLLYIQTFYLYLVLTKPSKKLILTFPKTLQNGTNCRPSYLVNEIEKLFPRISMVDVENRPFIQKELTSKIVREELMDYLSDSKKEWDDIFFELFKWYSSHPSTKEEMKALQAAFNFSGPKAELEETMVLALYGTEYLGAVSRLERFAACPYAHFAQYGLRIREREVFGFEPMDFGTVVHGALEWISKELGLEGISWDEMSQDKANQLIDEALEGKDYLPQNGILKSSGRDAYTLERIRRLLRRTMWALSKQMGKEEFKPFDFEVKFGSGKIDRIDLAEDEKARYVKVLDYKTGASGFSLSKLYYGLQLQLPVYLEEALELIKEKYPDKEVLPAGMFYYNVKDPFVDYAETKEEVEELIQKDLMPSGIMNQLPGVEHNIFNEKYKAYKKNSFVNPQLFEVISQFSRVKVRTIKKSIKAGEIKPSPYTGQIGTACAYCNYKAVCGFDEKLSGYSYREIPLSKNEEVLEAMEREVSQ